LNYGVLLAREGQLDEAVREFKETLQLDPGNQQARDYFNRIEDWKQRQSK
jgi:Flp pilus assembly protein TadD